jgi:GNAT superfamily N-acetyltransferase
VKQIAKFIAGQGMRNQWFDIPHASVYLRRSVPRPGIGDKPLDIATVAVDEEHRGKGIFTKLLKRIECLAILTGYDALYVESVLTDEFKEYFRKRGWTEKRDFGLSSFYRKLDA